jgi:hypothetical protein
MTEQPAHPCVARVSVFWPSHLVSNSQNARKDGNKTVILESDYDAFLESLPVLDLGAPAKDSEAAA